MFYHRDLKGDRLPHGTICLTYDDGPGPRTRELGEYLDEQHIAATFFVLGRHVEEYPGILEQLQACGHLIGNHTYNHPGLVSLALAGGEVVGELQKTDHLIRRFVSSDVVLFRAPYGNWREKTEPDGDEDKPISVVADILNHSGAFSDYVGPVNWDIVAEDWACWRQGLSAEECAYRYLAETERVGSGIILMHDSSEEAFVRQRNRTMQMTKILVPLLQERGYRFIRLDEVPQVREAINESLAQMEM